MAWLPAPKVTKKELENHLSKYFNLGKLLSYKKLKKGFANSLYHIKTKKGDFVFKIVIRHNSDKVLYEIDLLNTIHGLPVPKPIKTKEGQYLFDYKGYRAFVYPFLPGKEEKKFTKKMLSDIGEFLGKLHLQTEGFISPIERTEFYEISSKKLKRVIKESIHLKHPKIREALSYLKINALRYNLSARLPKGAMHIDLKPENTLFKRSKLTGVVDFDNSYIGPLIFDLADTLVWFCSEKGKFNITKAKIIYQGYESVKKFTAKEKTALFDALHNVFLAITLCGIDYLVQKKLPEYYIIWVIDNLLEAKKNLKLTKDEFQKIFK